ncbi:TPA: hypothetical protein I1717_000884 [Staphylococcus pseudintermedius]|nr:hypothetical protein [Staphylococcus pseudintermedius]
MIFKGEELPIKYKVTITLDENQKNKVQDLAELCDCKITTYVKMTALGNKIKPKVINKISAKEIEIVQEEFRKLDEQIENYERFLIENESELKVMLLKRLAKVLKKERRKYEEQNYKRY